MKPILVGLDNPHSKNSEHALWPSPANCSGWRLWKMLNGRVGLAEMEYVLAFERRNVVKHSSWNLPYVKHCADKMKKSFRRGSTVVLLGDEVRRAFGLKKLLIHAQVVDGVAYRQIPHPSGRNHFYNDPVQRELVAMLIEDLYRGATA